MRGFCCCCCCFVSLFKTTDLGVREHIQFLKLPSSFFFFFNAQGMSLRFEVSGSTIIILVGKRNYTKDFIFILLWIQTTGHQETGSIQTFLITVMGMKKNYPQRSCNRHGGGVKGKWPHPLFFPQQVTCSPTSRSCTMVYIHVVTVSRWLLGNHMVQKEKACAQRREPCPGSPLTDRLGGGGARLRWVVTAFISSNFSTLQTNIQIVRNVFCAQSIKYLLTDFERVILVCAGVTLVFGASVLVLSSA